MLLHVQEMLVKSHSDQKYTHECPSCNRKTYCAMEDGHSISACWCYGIEISSNEEIEPDKCKCKDCLKRE